MTRPRERELIPTEAVGVVMYHLFGLRRRLTTREVADLADCTRQGAEAMLGKLSRVTPLAYDPMLRQWYAFANATDGCTHPDMLTADR